MSQTITVPARFVRHLRRRLRIQMGFAAEHLAMLTLQLDDRLTQEAYEAAFRTLDGARALLAGIGIVEDANQEDVELDASEYPYLVLAAFESEYQAEMDRLEEVEANGAELPADQVEALGKFAAAVRRQLAGSREVGREDHHLRGYVREASAGQHRSAGALGRSSWRRWC
jgi:hypothetical protein